MQGITMQGLSRFPTFPSVFPRPWNQAIPMPPSPERGPESENEVPFIPPGVDWNSDAGESREEREEEETFIPPPIQVQRSVDRAPYHAPSRAPSRAPSESAPRHQQRIPTPTLQPPRPPPPQRPNVLFPVRAYKFRWSRREWKHSPTSGLNVDPARELELDRKKPLHDKLRIITWNVDMFTEGHEDRLYTALRQIEQDVLRCKDGDAPREACCIMLQEVRDTILPFLLRDGWVRRSFVVAPYTSDKWPEGARYGNVTLVSRALDIAECHILHFAASNMERTALCVKVRLAVPGTREKAVVALVNTHLESLPSGEAMRPVQLEMCTRFLQLRGVRGGVIAGDMNAISERDRDLAKKYGLKDSWRKGDEDEKGKTWGYQGQNAGYPCARLDKVLYLPERGYKVDPPSRIGVGLKVEEGRHPLWVSDHYGLETTLHMVRQRS